jgi:hypothetical protein
LDHAPCSPDLTLSDFHPFLKLKEYLTGHQFLSGIKAGMKMWFHQVDAHGSVVMDL